MCSEQLEIYCRKNYIQPSQDSNILKDSYSWENKTFWQVYITLSQ